MGPSIDQIIQKIQINGVLVRFKKIGPDEPPPPTGKTQKLINLKYKLKDQQNENNNNGDDISWKNSLVLIKKISSSHSCWQIPEAYWPESVKYIFIGFQQNNLNFSEIIFQNEPPIQ